MKKLMMLCLLLGLNNVFAGEITVGFSRGAPSAKQIALKAIGDAQKTLRIAAYQFTSPEIAKAVIAAKNRGVAVAVVLDKTQAAGDTQAAMVAAGIDCRIDTRFVIMHHKFAVIDGASVETGSFNYTLSAVSRNAENAIYITDTPAIAQQYEAQFWVIYKTAKPCAGGGQ